MIQPLDGLIPSMGEAGAKLFGSTRFQWLKALAILSCIADPVAADTFGLFTYTDNGTTITITDYPDTAVGPLTIPPTIVGKPVTMIASNAFDSCSGLTSVTLPDSVTGIGNYAFSHCTGMTSALLGNNVASIGEGAFYHCYDLAAMTIPASVTSIGELVFDLCISLTATSVNALNPTYCSVDGVLFNKSQTTLIKCPEGRVGNITIPPGCTSLRHRALSYSTRLTTISVDASNPVYSSLDGVLFNKNRTTLLQCPAGKAGVYAIHSSVTKTFTIRNTGTANLTNLAVTKTGKDAKNFALKAPLKTTLAPGASTTFKVTFKPSAKGNRKAAIHIKSNDGNENPFDIALTGKGVKKKKAAPSAARLPSWREPGGSARLDHDARQSTGTVRLADGRKYLTLTIMKSPEDFSVNGDVEVSPNLIDWFSGRKHTTVISDDASLLKVRDNIPLTPGAMRYIRMNRIGR